MSLDHLFTNRSHRVAVVAGVIMNSTDEGSGCPACGYEGFSTQWNKCLALAEAVVEALDDVESEAWRKDSVRKRDASGKMPS